MILRVLPVMVSVGPSEPEMMLLLYLITITKVAKGA
jgi:hypothetical protein